MTKQQKIANYDRIAAELAKLELAMFDTVCKGTRFPFEGSVKVDANDIDTTYEKGQFKCTVSVSLRSMPVYRVLTDTSVEFFTESEIDERRANQGIMYRLLRHAIWLQRVRKVA